MTNPVWAQWGRVTRFLESSRVALGRESYLWTSLGLLDHSATKIQVLDGESTYQASVAEHTSALNDVEIFCSMVLIHSFALVEDATAGVLNVQTPLSGGIESWGNQLLCHANASWDDVKDGKVGAVEVAVVRNTLAHGTWVVDQASANRLSNVSPGHAWTVGHRVEMTFQVLDEYRARLKSLLRVAQVR